MQPELEFTLEAWQRITQRGIAPLIDGGGVILVEALSQLGDVEWRLADPAARTTLERALKVATGVKLPATMIAPAQWSLAQLFEQGDRAHARTLATAARDVWASDMKIK